MLTLRQYGIRLIRLQEEDIELVRNWRNQHEIASKMEYREYITAEDQKKWFRTINNKYNYYFLIIYKNKKVGLINAKNYDPSRGFGEGGIFIGEQTFVDSFAAVYSTLCLLNFIFFKLHLKQSNARILRNNLKAIQYNKLIGYKLLPGQENVENQLYQLTVEDYKKYGKRLNRAAALLNLNDRILKYSGEPEEINLDEINQLLKEK